MSDNDIIDLFDKDGNVVGNIRRGEFKQAITPDRLVHAVVVAITNSKGEWLVQQRSATKSTGPNMLCLGASGFRDQGESLEVSAMRELEEELGINVDSIDYVGYILRQNGCARRFIYHAVYDGYDITIQESEVKGAHWISRDSLEKIVEVAPFMFFAEDDKAFKMVDKFLTEKK